MYSVSVPARTAVFSKGNRECVGNGRAGSKVHPCTVLPKCRIHAAFSLGVEGFLKKMQAVGLKN